MYVFDDAFKSELVVLILNQFDVMSIRAAVASAADTLGCSILSATLLGVRDAS